MSPSPADIAIEAGASVRLPFSYVLLYDFANIKPHATIKLMQRIIATFTYLYFWFTKREARVWVRSDD